MQKEYDALIKNDTWKLVDPTFGTKPIGCKWVYKNKYKADGSLDKHKARLVAKGFAMKGHEHKVCKPVKSLYGLKQAPRAWYEKLTEHLLKLNFNHFGLDDATLFVKKVGKTIVYLVVWHDRVQSSYYSNGTNLKLTSIEGKEFEDATKYRQLVGSLYLTTTRPDISFAVGILSRFMQKPCEGHWSAAKRVLRYFKGTQDLGIKYTQVDDFSLIGYSDSDFDGDKETGVSTSGYDMSL
eukprot:PITA_13624